MLSKLNIYDIMQAADSTRRANYPVLDIGDALDNEQSLYKSCRLLYLAMHKGLKTAAGLYEPSTLLLCGFESDVFLIDERANLWDIKNIDDEDMLSVLSVGYLGFGIDGFVLDLKDKYPELMDEWWCNFLDD